MDKPAELLPTHTSARVCTDRQTYRDRLHQARVYGGLFGRSSSTVTLSADTFFNTSRTHTHTCKNTHLGHLGTCSGTLCRVLAPESSQREWALHPTWESTRATVRVVHLPNKIEHCIRGIILTTFISQGKHFSTVDYLNNLTPHQCRHARCRTPFASKLQNKNVCVWALVRGQKRNRHEARSRIFGCLSPTAVTIKSTRL